MSSEVNIGLQDVYGYCIYLHVYQIMTKHDRFGKKYKPKPVRLSR